MVIAVEGHIQHSWLVFKSVLDTIAMVHIPVNNQYPVDESGSKKKQLLNDNYNQQ